TGLLVLGCSPIQKMVVTMLNRHGYRPGPPFSVPTRPSKDGRLGECPLSPERALGLGARFCFGWMVRSPLSRNFIAYLAKSVLLSYWDCAQACPTQNIYR